MQRSIEDQSFHQELVRNPKPTIEREFGTSLPENINVVVHETDPDTIHLVLPSRSHIESGFTLSDEELEMVSGGTASCDSGLSCWGDVRTTGRVVDRPGVSAAGLPRSEHPHPMR